jgi:cation diffusion facilitator CzcD-associated flavoprotein CzcO
VSNVCPVAIIGAGPYGLSLAAYLRARGVKFRIFGTPMYSWQTQMPSGMLLKSHGFASNLFDPQHCYPLKRFCAKNAIEYNDYGLPVSLETFTAYRLSFQKQFVPDVEDRAVVVLEQSFDGFRLRLDNGDTVAARRVVVAVGASYFRYVPGCLSHLSPESVSHSSEHHDLSRFKGRDVTVLGAGASALDLVASLHGAGATVRLTARRSSLEWNTAYDTYRPLWRRWYPLCGLGGGDWRKRFYEYGPCFFAIFRQRPDCRLCVRRSVLQEVGLLGNVSNRCRSCSATSYGKLNRGMGGCVCGSLRPMERNANYRPTT